MCVCMHFICLTKFIFRADYLRIVLLDLPLMVQPHQHPTPKEPMATCCRVPKSHTAPLFLNNLPFQCSDYHQLLREKQTWLINIILTKTINNCEPYVSSSKEHPPLKKTV